MNPHALAADIALFSYLCKIVILKGLLKNQIIPA